MELALQDKAVVQDAARATALDRVALAASVGAVDAVAVEALALVVVWATAWIKNALGWRPHCRA
jgi:hypothetical protein